MDFAEKQLHTLEFPKILERLAYHAMFSASKALALALKPSPYLAEVEQRQAETREARHLLSVKVNVGVGGARDVRPLVERAKRGIILSALELVEIRQTLIAARDLQRTILRLAEAYPRLADIAQRIETCPGLVNEINQAIDERGDVKNNATPNLARIRRELETAHSRLMEKLNRLVTSPQYNRYLQENLITQRAGRYVVPLKAEFKGRIQGVIHDQSASGATLFIEPLSTVELNNKWRQLQLDEADEIRRILMTLSESVGNQGRLIQHTVVALAELDLAFAKARYAEAIDAIEPILFTFDDMQREEQGRSGAGGTALLQANPPTPLPVIKLMSARHPLLNSETVVPIEVSLPENIRLLVITGPNTGGKTVSLKTVGLLAVMAQAGLQIPAAEGSTLPVFNHIFADIGDEQSIEQNLSTFSSHMTQVVQILEQCDHRSLVIFDELGAGTDPIEGSALARSILSHLLERQVTTFVATHYSELKAYAHATHGITNASMEFDLNSLAPTYRLLIGLPGASNAFTIARRLGLSQDIINTARGLVGQDAQQIEAMLAEIRAQTEAARQLRHLAEVERQEAEDYTQQLQHRLAEIDLERRDILDSARQDARREIKKVREEIRALKEQAQAEIQAQLEPGPEKTRSNNRELLPADTWTGIAQQLDQLETRVEAKIRKTPPETRPLKPGVFSPGDKVFIKSFNTIGEVVTVHNKQLEVQLGRFRATVSAAEAELRERADSHKPEPDQSQVKVPAAESPGFELDLRGQVTEEALLNLDQYLDQAFLARLPWVRIIHGKGSGALRQAVRQELSNHPMIASYRSGQEGEGGEGVTVAKLAVN